MDESAQRLARLAEHEQSESGDVSPMEAKEAAAVAAAEVAAAAAAEVLWL